MKNKALNSTRVNKWKKRQTR